MAVHNGDTDTATDELGFDPFLLKDSGFFRKIGDGGGSAAGGPWRSFASPGCLGETHYR